MRDLTDLYRSTIGFDRLFSLMNDFSGFENVPSYPPYNIERLGEDTYRISMAVAGFSEGDINIELKEQTLIVKGDKTLREQDSNREILHQGIAARNFERRFQLADYIQVTGASMENGLLHVDLKREVPEEKKPRTIAIKSGKQPQVIDGSKKAA